MLEILLISAYERGASLMSIPLAQGSEHTAGIPYDRKTEKKCTHLLLEVSGLSVHQTDWISRFLVTGHSSPVQRPEL